MLARRWFSQTGEDRRLYSILSHIKHGRYVDIGAYEPEFHSVTKVFYDDGWSGVNVEPNPRAFAMLQKQRSRDTNYDCVITWKKGLQDFYVTDRRGRSSLDKGFAASSGLETKKIKVATKTLVEVWPEGEVHLLKIDTEGAEKDVITSGDWQHNRPWVTVVESLSPKDMRIKTHHEWESYLTSNGYVFKLDDGLNRYYIAKERLDNLGSLVQ